MTRLGSLLKRAVAIIALVALVTQLFWTNQIQQLTESKLTTKTTEADLLRWETSSPRHFSVPHILHQTFASEMVYENYKPLINSCLTLNPDWTYYLWRDSDAEALLSEHYPQYLSTYKGFKDNLQRSDAIRYVILHRFGGIYLDMDVECVKPFHPTLTAQAAILDQERQEQTRILWNWEFSAMNSLMGSVPGHPFYRIMSQKVLTKLVPGNAFYTTGPAVLTQVFREYRDSPAASSWPVTLLPPSVASPLMDWQTNWKEVCRGAKRRGDNDLSWMDIACHVLQSKNFSLDDSNEGTVAVHRFLHLGYNYLASNRKPMFSMANSFKPRIMYYKRGNAG